MPGGPAGLRPVFPERNARARPPRGSVRNNRCWNGRHSNAPSAAPPESRVYCPREIPAPSVAHQIQADTPHRLVCDGGFTDGCDEPPRPADHRSGISSPRSICLAHRSIHWRIRFGFARKLCRIGTAFPAVVRARGGPLPHRWGEDNPRGRQSRAARRTPSFTYPLPLAGEGRSCLASADTQCRAERGANGVRAAGGATGVSGPWTRPHPREMLS